MIIAKKDKNRGISLIELIIVIAIMGILVGVLSPMFMKYVAKSKKSKDVYTADQIARAVNVAFIENQMAYDTFQAWDQSTSGMVPQPVSVTVNGVTRSYEVFLFASNGTQDRANRTSNCFNGEGRGLYKHDKNGTDGFYGTINRELGLSTTEMNQAIIPRYQPSREGVVTFRGGSRPVSDLDRWRIVKRKDNGMMEIWVAQGSPFGGFPIYRLWPEPDDEYTK